MTFFCYIRNLSLLPFLIGAITYRVDGQHTVTVTANTNQPTKGSEQQLTCAYVNLNGKRIDGIIWSKGKQFQGASVISTYQNGEGITYNNTYGDAGDYVMSMPAPDGNDGGSTKLTIKSIVLDDIGTFWCNVNAAGFPVEENIVLDVLVPPSSTSISLALINPATGDSVEVLENTVHSFNCETVGVRPSAVFTWLLDETEQNTDDPTNVPNSEDARLTDCKSILNVKPSYSENHNDQLSCSANIAEKPTDIASTHVFLDVKVPPTNNTVFLEDASGRLNEGSNVRVDEGQSHSFTCNVQQTRPAATFDWEPKNTEFVIGQPIVPTAGDSLVDSSQSLTIPLPSSASHHGINLKCKTNIDITDSLQPVIRSVIIQVYGPPEEPTLAGNINDMTEGIAERLECKAVNGFPAGDVKWYINNQEIKDKHVFNNLNLGGRFDIISNITVNPNKDLDGSLLKCDVLHETLQPGEVMSAVQTIVVKYSPHDVTINQSPANPVIENTPVTLNCTADANPKPDHFVWLKNENDTQNDAETLQFPSINRNDEGLYKCKAMNGIGTEGISPVIVVTVHYPPENVVLTKSIDDPLQEGDSVVLICTSGGKPLPTTFRWFQDDMLLADTNNNEFTLQNVKKEHAGKYKCEAENGIPTNTQSNEVDVIVYYNPNSDPQTSLIIGASIAGAVLVLIIVALLIYFVHLSKTRKGGGTGNGSLELVSSNGANVGISNPASSTSDVPLYAQVNKDQKKNVPVYAQVNKDQKKNVPTYADVKKEKKTNEDAYDAVANVRTGTNTQEQENENESDGRTISPEGLIYQSVGNFNKSHPTDAPPIQTEESTDYAELNFKVMKAGKKKMMSQMRM